MRLGEFLIQKGVINKAQLEQALRAQLIFGGHLGTCLMEMGLVDEQLLGESLAAIFRVRYAPPALFADVPRSVIETMTQRLVEKYHAVPFERTNRMLHLAMIDPKNLPALDEISFATACKIEPWVAPEARIFQVMERYYDIPRRQRYIAVCQDMDGGPGGQRGKDAHQEPVRAPLVNTYAPPPYLEALGAAKESEELSAPEEPSGPTPASAPQVEDWGGGPPPAPPMHRTAPPAPAAQASAPSGPGWQAPVPPAPFAQSMSSPYPPAPATVPSPPPAQSVSPFAPPPPSSPRPDPYSTFRPATRPLAGEFGAPQPAAPQVAEPRSVEPPSTAPRSVTPQQAGLSFGASPITAAQPAATSSGAPSIAAPQPAAYQPAAEPPRSPGNFAQEGLSNRLCQAETAEDLSQCALDYASHGLERCALFLIRSTNASLWCSRGLGWDQERGRILNLSVTSDPLFELLLERDHYRGPVPEDVGIRASFKSMRIEVPSELLLVPGYVEDRMIVLLYGDGGVNGPIRGDTADLCTFVRKLAYALHVVMLKRKLRSLDLRPPGGSSMRAA